MYVNLLNESEYILYSALSTYLKTAFFKWRHSTLRNACICSR